MLIKVAIFEDNKHLRESLQILLNGTPGYTCVGAYPACSYLLPHLKANQCDIVLMDIEMPGMSGIEATRIIKESLPHVQVLIQTVFFDDDSIFRAICAGASGYILKTTTPAAYMEAIRDVHSGGSPMTAGIARRVMELFRANLQPPTTENYELTDREKDVLQHLVSGKSYKMIADAIQISHDTVKTHIKNIYVKLRVHSSSEAVAKVIRERII